MEKILLVGGAGFIGSHIARKLLETGKYKVYIFDSFTQYTSPFESNLYESLQYRFRGIKDQIKFYRGDARFKDDVRRIMEEVKPDRIIHLAHIPLSNISNIHIDEAVQSVIVTTTNILEECVRLPNLRRFVYASSSMVYGDFKQFPASEDHPKNPKCIYGAAKLCGETLTGTFGRLFNVNYTIIRPSAVYGPTDINKRVSQIFIENALDGKELILKGHNSALDFTYVDDIADGFILGLIKDEAGNEIFNMTRGEGRLLKDFAEIVAKYVPDIKIIIKDADPHMPARGALDISKARRMLGFNPKFSLEEGIEQYLSKRGSAAAAVGKRAEDGMGAPSHP